MTMITPSYLGETIEYSSLHACRSTLEDPTVGAGALGLGSLGAAGLSAVGKDEMDPVIDPEEERRQRLVALIEAEATGKMAMDKTAITHAIGALAGLPLGAAMAPHGHRHEGALRGFVTGRNVGLFGGLGAIGGGLGGHLLGNALGGYGGEGALLGAGLGGLGGGIFGHSTAHEQMGKPSWEKKPKHKGEHKDHDKKAFIYGAAIGGPLGAIKAPKNHGWEGAGRGALAGAGLETGAGLGSTIGMLGGGLSGAGLGGTVGYGLGRVLGGEQGGLTGAGIGAIGGGLTGGLGGLGYGAYKGGEGGYDLANYLMGKPSWEKKPKHKKDEKHEKEGHYPGCRSSRKHQTKQKKTKQRRVRRKHASAELVGSLMGVIKQAAAIKCGCGCSTCAKCGTGEKQKVRVINGPQIRTNKGHFAWRGRNAKAVSDDPSYEHFGTKAGSLGTQAATLALSMPAT